MKKEIKQENNKEVKNETKTSNSLMRKTKAELCEIILRKDDVEIKLREKVKENQCEIDRLNNIEIGNFKNEIDNLLEKIKIYKDKCVDYAEGLKDVSDELATIKTESIEIKDIYNKYKIKYNNIKSLLISSIVINIILLFSVMLMVI